MYQNCCAQLCELHDKEKMNIDISAVGAGLGGCFDHASKLKVMKFKEAKNGLDSNKWKEDITNKRSKW